MPGPLGKLQFVPCATPRLAAGRGQDASFCDVDGAASAAAASVDVAATEIRLPIADARLAWPASRCWAQVSVRGTESAPGWERADLSPEVVMLERPDVDGPAYCEFRVRNGERDAGYIIASATDGDFPIAHWDFVGQSPTAQLDELAKDRAVGVYYKLDTVAYAAEDERGELVANIGALPSRIRGQDPTWLDDPVADSTATWVPDRQTRSDQESRGVGGKLVEEGPPLRDIALEPWDSWDDLKRGYRESYETVIESLRRQAAEEWGTEALAEQFGEGLVATRARSSRSRCRSAIRTARAR